jgi:1-acyl-sn-glycerol-3-phosphate acyltransferase
MLEFRDAPYQFFEPRPWPLVIALARQANRFLVLPGKNHRIRSVDLSGEIGDLATARARGDRLLFVCNHPSHSDPQILTEAFRQLRLPVCFMAAYDVFLRSPSTAWVMQRLGHFSIDREAADRKAVSTAIGILAEGTTPLTIFPEGNVYLTNDRVTPFLEGPAFIALKALAGENSSPVKIVPLSLKLTHLTECQDLIQQRLSQLALDSGFSRTIDHAWSADLVPLGLHLLKRFLADHDLPLPDSDGATLQERITTATDTLTTSLENDLALAAKPADSLAERIRRIRGTLHGILIQGPAENVRSDAPALARRAILAFRLLAYLTPYWTEHPTLDRLSETAERLCEDFHSRPLPPIGPRRAMVHVGAPLDVAAYLEESAGKSREALAALTMHAERSVQRGIDALNASNRSPGNLPHA